MVIGLFPSADAAGMCVTNLEEEDFSRRDISVVMQTPRAAADLANVSGPLNGLTVDALVERLIGLGLAPDVAGSYRDGIRRGGVFVAVAAGDASDAAKETFADFQGQQVRVVGTP
jgi:hypothetical protein